jgi:hypothetical protein
MTHSSVPTLKPASQNDPNPNRKATATVEDEHNGKTRCLRLYLSSWLNKAKSHGRGHRDLCFYETCRIEQW